MQGNKTKTKYQIGQTVKVVRRSEPKFGKTHVGRSGKIIKICTEVKDCPLYTLAFDHLDKDQIVFWEEELSNEDYKKKD